MKRKSFIIHIDSLDVIKELSDAQAGQLFRAIKAYQNGEEYPLDGLMKAIFIPFKNQFERDDTAYQSICERNKNNGIRGGRPKNPENPVGSLGTQNNPNKPKKPDNDSKNDSDSESVKEEIPFFIPLEAWSSYCKHRGSKFSPKAKSLALKKLETWHNEGQNIEEILNNSVMNNWKGIFPQQTKGKANGKYTSNDALHEALADIENGEEETNPLLCSPMLRITQ